MHVNWTGGLEGSSLCVGGACAPPRRTPSPAHVDDRLVLSSRAARVVRAKTDSGKGSFVDP